MAMIYCRECNKQFSDMAEDCPVCGCPVCGVSTEVTPKDFDNSPKKQNKMAFGGFVLGMIIFGLGLVFLGYLIFLYRSNVQISALRGLNLIILCGAIGAICVCVISGIGLDTKRKINKWMAIVGLALGITSLALIGIFAFFMSGGLVMLYFIFTQ
jgi:predicted membrane protein